MTTTLGRRGFLAAAAAAGAGLSATPALALTLDEAKAAGLIGEMPNGYVGSVSGGGDVQALVDSVNTQRRARYQQVAAGNGVPLAAVEQQAGAQLIARTPPGQFIMTAEGRWVRK